MGPWTYIWFTSDRSRERFNVNELFNTMKGFQNFLHHSGINAGGFIETPPPPTINLMDGQTEVNDRLIKDMFQRMQNKVRFLICVMPFHDVGIYNTIKTLADTKGGFSTLCTIGQKFMKVQRQEQYFGNLALKINLKAGGINHTLDPAKLGIVSQGKTMVVGIDVTHPSPGSKGTAPSAAGVVASVDALLGQWPATFSIQESRKEMVTALESMILSRLRLWQKHNKQQLPENIIVYRDGVSEGQYQILLDQELPLIRNACRQAYPATATKQNIPKISIIVCGKRHHTRFYPATEGDASRSANCQPGTVVDRGVNDVRGWDFFIQPHECLQGTARPCHYYVILDEIFRGRHNKPPHQNAADALEDLTHNMCHLFGRATKAVSLCPPAYNADLLCTRLRCYLSAEFDPSESLATQSVTSGASAPSSTASDLAIPNSLKDTMFYI